MCTIQDFISISTLIDKFYEESLREKIRVFTCGLFALML